MSKKHTHIVAHKRHTVTEQGTRIVYEKGDPITPTETMLKANPKRFTPILVKPVDEPGASGEASPSPQKGGDPAENFISPDGRDSIKVIEAQIAEGKITRQDAVDLEMLYAPEHRRQTILDWSEGVE